MRSIMALFTLIHQDKNTRARTGMIQTSHGDIETPEFMPVGTQATVKSLDVNDLNIIGAQIILGNTYHLHLRPGEDLIAEFGGLHQFMGWDKPILTDSGGFQVFSLAARNIRTSKTTIRLRSGQAKIRNHENNRTMDKFNNENQGRLVNIDEDGVTFRSHIDGSEHRFTPETSIKTQRKLGADIIMAFDECTPDSADEKYTREAMERTHRWAERSLSTHQQYNNETVKQYKQFLFGIIQGSNHKHLREESAQFISSLNFDGIAIGGESIGYNMAATKNILDWVMPYIPDDKPYYTMGVGYSPFDLFEVIERGVDIFDCVAPTRVARNGTLYVNPKTFASIHTTSTDSRHFRLNINNAQFRNDRSPIDPICACFTCLHHTRAYLHHLFNAEELLAYRLATIHNVYFFLNLMKQIREAIKADRFLELKQSWL